MDRRSACAIAASACREEAERDPVRRHAWMLQAEKWLAIGCEAYRPVRIVVECQTVEWRDDVSASGLPDHR